MLWALFSALTTPPPTPDFFSRLSEQTLLVEKLTEQNSKKERTISSLKMDVQKLVRGAEKRQVQGGGPPAGPAEESAPAAGVPAQRRPAGSGHFGGPS